MRNNTNDFSVAKIGDRVWDFINHWGTIIDIDTDNGEVLVKFDDDAWKAWYYMNGTRDGVQRLFWDEIKFAIPGKPLNLKGFLKEQLVPVEFDSSCENYCFVYDNIYNKFTVSVSQYDEYATVYFHYDNVDYVAEVLSDEQITMKELVKAFKELGWL